MSHRKPLHELVVEHASALRAYFRRRVRHRPNAPDLAQEVFLRLLRRASDGRVIENPEAYLFTVAAHVVQEHEVAERRRAARTVAMTDPLVTAQLTVHPSLDGDVDTDLRRRRLRAVLYELPPRSVAVLKMLFEEDLSYAAIAGRLGISKTMAAKIVARTLKQCRRRMAPWEAGGKGRGENP